MYPDVDFLHVGELGDATDQLIEPSTAWTRARTRRSSFVHHQSTACR